MAATLAALIFAHVIADFVLQSRWMVAGKRKPLPLLCHGAVVLGATILTLGFADPLFVALAAAHIVIDAIKAFCGRSGLWPFCADQAAHLASLVAVALIAPDLWSASPWAGLVPLPGVLTVAAGLIVTTRAGGFAVGFLMEPLAAPLAGLPNGGRLIGTLERGLIFLLVMTGQTQGIGFLIAAKSVLRFGTVGDDRAVSEYVIIGTLASFGWAIAVAFGTIAYLQHLPPLGIAASTP